MTIARELLKMTESISPVDCDGIQKEFELKLKTLKLDAEIIVSDVDADLDGNVYVSISTPEMEDSVEVAFSAEDTGVQAMVSSGTNAIVIDLSAMNVSVVHTDFGVYPNILDLSWLNKNVLLTILNAAGLFAPDDCAPQGQDAFGNLVQVPAVEAVVTRGGKPQRLPIVREMKPSALSSRQKMAHMKLKAPKRESEEPTKLKVGDKVKQTNFAGTQTYRTVYTIKKVGSGDQYTVSAPGEEDMEVKGKFLRPVQAESKQVADQIDALSDADITRMIGTTKGQVISRVRTAMANFAHGQTFPNVDQAFSAFCGEHDVPVRKSTLGGGYVADPDKFKEKIGKGLGESDQGLKSPASGTDKKKKTETTTQESPMSTSLASRILASETKTSVKPESLVSGEFKKIASSLDMAYKVLGSVGVRDLKGTDVDTKEVLPIVSHLEAAIKGVAGIIKKLETTGESVRENIITDLEKAFSIKIKPGRNTIDGYPVDIEDQDPADGAISLDPVDKDTLRGLLQVLKSKGFKATAQGSSILIED
jgi:hypothetical protein